MQIRQFFFKLNVIVGGARDVACAACPRATGIDRRVHGI